MEMKLDWRSIYTKLLRKKKKNRVLVYPVAAAQSPLGDELDDKRIYMELRPKMSHSWTETRQLTIRTGTKQITPKCFLSRMETEKLLKAVRHYWRTRKHSVFFLKPKEEKSGI